MPSGVAAAAAAEEEGSGAEAGARGGEETKREAASHGHQCGERHGREFVGKEGKRGGDDEGGGDKPPRGGLLCGLKLMVGFGLLSGCQWAACYIVVPSISFFSD